VVEEWVEEAKEDASGDMIVESGFEERWI